MSVRRKPTFWALSRERSFYSSRNLLSYERYCSSSPCGNFGFSKFGFLIMYICIFSVRQLLWNSYRRHETSEYLSFSVTWSLLICFAKLSKRQLNCSPIHLNLKIENIQKISNFFLATPCPLSFSPIAIFANLLFIKNTPTPFSFF